MIDDPQRPTVERFVAAVADSTGTTGDVAGTVDRVAASARASLPVVETIGDPSQEAALRLWALLAPLGSLAPGAPVGPTSRAWFEELRLGAGGRGCAAGPRARRGRRVVGRGARARAAWTCRSRRRPADGWTTAHPGSSRHGWRTRRSAAFLRINAWDGVEWFHRESWAELVAWADRLERVVTPIDERAVRPVERSVVARQLLEAGEASGYRIDRLREALVAGVAPGTSATPRLPRATGLPPGPAGAAGAARHRRARRRTGARRRHARGLGRRPIGPTDGA